MMQEDVSETGEMIDGFRVEEVLRAGGMAKLFRVSREGDPARLLMKIPNLGHQDDPAQIVSFEMETMILPRLSGPHVPRFVAAGGLATTPYLVMEFLPGKTLLSRLSELPLPYEEVAAIGRKVAQALHELHLQHVIHLDVKPSNIMFRDSGEAVLLDYGLSHHDQLPDLMSEEFRLPYGTAPYMSPEQLRNIRNEPRSDLFALGVLLYFFSTGVRPFGEGERLSTMRRRLWRDPVPPRKLRADYPPWLQEIVLRCLEVHSASRYPSAAQLAFDLANPDQVRLTARSERLARDRWTTVLRRRFNTDLARPRAREALDADLALAPIVAVAIDLDSAPALNETMRMVADRLLSTMPSARLACINVLKQSRVSIDSPFDEEGRNKHLDRLVALRHWAEPLKLAEQRLTVHVLEAVDAADAILEFAQSNRVDQILLGARQQTLMRKVLGSVSEKVAAQATCTVTVVRPSGLATGSQG